MRPKILKTDSPDPWERQQKESSQAFEAFCVYRDMGAARSYKAVGQSLGKSRVLIERWGSTWAWSERVRAWDNESAKQARRAADNEIRDMTKRHITIALRLQSKALRALDDIPIEEVSARDVSGLMKLGLDVERLNRGEPTERIEGKTTHDGEISVQGSIDLSNLSDAELEQLDVIARKISSA